MKTIYILTSKKYTGEIETNQFSEWFYMTAYLEENNGAYESVIITTIKI